MLAAQSHPDVCPEEEHGLTTDLAQRMRAVLRMAEMTLLGLASLRPVSSAPRLKRIRSETMTDKIPSQDIFSAAN
jgi:hypothetical protein